MKKLILALALFTVADGAGIFDCFGIACRNLG